jgi:hypothetical protein
LRLTKGYVPPDIWVTSLGTLRSALPAAAADRIWEKRVLWLTRACPSQVAKLHAGLLRTKFAYGGLDLTELRAVFTSLPPKFESDPTKEKEEWRAGLLALLRERVASAGRGDLRGEKLRASCYEGLDEQGGPFDPDASAELPKVQESLQSRGEDIRNELELCRRRSVVSESRPETRSSREASGAAESGRSSPDPPVQKADTRQFARSDQAQCQRAGGLNPDFKKELLNVFGNRSSNNKSADRNLTRSSKVVEASPPVLRPSIGNELRNAILSGGQVTSAVAPVNGQCGILPIPVVTSPNNAAGTALSRQHIAQRRVGKILSSESKSSQQLALIAQISRHVREKEKT